MRDGDWAAAERATRDYLKRAGGDLNAHTRLGIILRHLGDLNGALHVLKGVLQRDHRHALASQELGLTCLAMDLFQPAKLALKRALELKPGLVSAWLGLAEVHEAQNRPGLALRVYRDALRMTKRHKQGPICGRMGMLLARIGDREHARRLLERAIRSAGRPVYVFLLGSFSGSSGN